MEARRRVDAKTSARRSNKEMGPSRPNPLGGWGLRAISLSFVTKRRKGRPDKARDRGPRGVLVQYVEEADGAQHSQDG